jgi:hypothetical protein
MTNILLAIIGTVAALVVAAAIAAWVIIRRRNLHLWLRPHFFPIETSPPVDDDTPVDVYLAVCDHYEPQCYGASREKALERVLRWQTEYPKLFSRFRDDSGRPPQHTFFFPQDEYRPEYLDALKPLVEAGYGDVDIHLHHDADTAESLEQKLAEFRDTLFHQHGLLRRNPKTGRTEYGFIHGNWALCNSRPDGLLCGVGQELTVLLKTGCYADFTMPSAPSATQTQTINSIYYAKDIPGRCKSHDEGIRSQVGLQPPADHLLMIQGPLLLDWQSRKFRTIPRIENGDIHAGRPATLRRFQLWRQAYVHVAGRFKRQFIMLHSHGC